MGQQPSSMTENSVTFSVDKVERYNEKPFSNTIQRVLKDLGVNIDNCEDFSHKGNSEENIIYCDVPGLMAAVHIAYSNHYALKLSVSDFIILIGQGLGRHIEKHAEKLREHFVSHQGKEMITISRDEFVKGQNNDWSTVFGEFADEIKRRVKADVHGVIIDDTSVATPTTRIVSEITLMDAMKSYFDYTVMTKCGIPEITLEGTPEDWQKLKKKVAKLVEMNKADCLSLKWWLDELVPLVDKICKAGIERKIDASFWREIYKYKGRSGTPYITGWITVFFPYLTEGKVNSFSKKTITSDDIPKQISQIDFIWKYLGKEIPMLISGGFVGAEFDKESRNVKPSYFWSVTYK